MHQPIKYRSDIDGLRALAILPVVFYHAEWWPFTGGYVGVDIFFVISGYLITSIIFREVKEGTFSFVNFYERRVRRILPALFAVLFFCCCAAYGLLSEYRYEEFSETLIATILFSSNYVLWNHSSGYFDSMDQMKPLLHTWSLSIEEQFYLFFPVFMLLVNSMARNAPDDRKKLFFGIAVYGIAIISFSLSAATAIYGVAVRTSFFLPPFRVWELAMGAILALGLVPTLHNQRVREILAVLGLGCILVAILAYDHETVFPGYAAFLPCFGTALIIYSGEGHPTAVGRLLGLKPLVFIGLISYSLYLWHWPLLASVRIANFGYPDFTSSFVAVAVSVVLSILSWRYVERPFRGKGAWLSRGQVFSSAGFVSLLFILFGVYGLWSHGWEGRPQFLHTISHSPKVLMPLYARQEAEDDVLWGNKVFNKKEEHTIISNSFRKFIGFFVKSIKENDNNYEKKLIDSVRPSYILIGDSHARALERLLFSMASEDTSKFYSIAAPGRWPIVGLQLISKSWSGEDWDAGPSISAILSSNDVKTVILSNRYAPYLIPDASSGIIGGDDLLEESTGNILDPKDIALREEKVDAYFTSTIDALLNAGKRVVLVYPVPEVGFDGLREMTRRFKNGEDMREFLYPMKDFWEHNRSMIAIMDALGEHPNLIRIKPYEVLCDGQWCKGAVNGRTLYFDDNHLSRTGVELLRPQFEAIFEADKKN